MVGLRTVNSSLVGDRISNNSFDGEITSKSLLADRKTCRSFFGLQNNKKSSLDFLFECLKELFAYSLSGSYPGKLVIVQITGGKALNIPATTHP